MTPKSSSAQIAHLAQSVDMSGTQIYDPDNRGNNDVLEQASEKIDRLVQQPYMKQQKRGNPTKSTPYLR